MHPRDFARIGSLSLPAFAAAARDVSVDFAFLTPGKRYRAEIWRDGAGGGIGGDRFAMAVETRTVTSATKWPIRMEAAGGFAIASIPLP